MYRRWRVRHSYPEPVVELAVRLIPVHGATTLSRLLDIPTSVIYRWRTKYRDRPAQTADPVADAQAVATLAARCEELGFRVPGYMRAASGHVPASNDSPRAGSATSTPSGDGIDHRVDRRTAHAGEATNAAGPAHAAGRLRTAGQRYVFDASRARPERGVRTRMEAVRQDVDARYFLDLDCRTLAESAGMSLHHFMRVFRDMFGMSPHQYLTRARVEAAKRLLLASSEPIEVIAVGVGFRSGPCLNRAFKRIEGRSASKYCQMAKKAGVARRPWASPMPAAAPEGPRHALE
jgi:AraC-like DNA-binding protein